MTFFSTPERIEIGGIPFIASHEKPTRTDGLIYYRRVAEHYGLDIRPGEDGDRRPPRRRTAASPSRLRRAHDREDATAPPRGVRHRLLRQPELPARARRGPAPRRALLPRGASATGASAWSVIGAGNSSVDAALECWRAGATVTLVHFGEAFDRTVKAWVLPDITNRVKEGSIAAALAVPRAGDHADRCRGRLGGDRGRRAAAVPTRCWP